MSLKLTSLLYSITQKLEFPSTSITVTIVGPVNSSTHGARWEWKTKRVNKHDDLVVVTKMYLELNI